MTDKTLYVSKRRFFWELHTTEQKVRLHIVKQQGAVVRERVALDENYSDLVFIALFEEFFLNYVDKINLLDDEVISRYFIAAINLGVLKSDEVERIKRNELPGDGDGVYVDEITSDIAERVSSLEDYTGVNDEPE